MIVVTDNAMLAARDYPGARIVASEAELAALPAGTAVAVRPYRIGVARDDPVIVARALIARGVLTGVPR